MSDRWSEKATKILIFEYRRCELLYNSRHADYKNRNKRLNAYKEIEKVLIVNGFQYTTEDVKKKLNGLRSQYLAEKLKIANSIKSGDDIHKPTVYWYDLLKFLETCTAADESISYLDTSNGLEVPPQSEEMDLSVERPIATNTASTSGNSEDRSSQRINNKRKWSSNNTDSMMCQALRAMTEMTRIIKDHQSSDTVDNFVQFIADELRGIRDAGGDALMSQVKRKIQQVILQSWDTIDYQPQAPSSPSSSVSSQTWNPIVPEPILQETSSQNFQPVQTQPFAFISRVIKDSKVSIENNHSETSSCDPTNTP